MGLYAVPSLLTRSKQRASHPHSGEGREARVDPAWEVPGPPAVHTAVPGAPARPPALCAGAGCADRMSPWKHPCTGTRQGQARRVAQTLNIPALGKAA